MYTSHQSDLSRYKIACLTAPCPPHEKNFAVKLKSVGPTPHPCQHQAQGYKTVFMLNSAEHEILNAHKYNKRAMMALGRSPEYHWNQIISKSVHRSSRRSLLKLFSIYCPGGHFVQLSRTV